MSKYKHIAIIGNGISGVTAARFIRKKDPDVAITIISAETEYFFSRTALMYIYMGHLGFKDTQPYEPWFWEKNRINLIQAWVTNIDPQAKSLDLSSGKTVEYDALILAIGSTFNKFNWPGQDSRGVSGLYSYQDLEYVETYTKDAKEAVIVGGGLIGIELSEMLLSRGIKVTILVRESSYWNNVLPEEESAMVNRHIKEHHIDLRLNTELKEIKADETGRCSAVITSSGEEIPCQFVGLTAGVHPNIGWMDAGWGIQCDRGVLINEFFETSVPDVFAIGDCAQFREPLPGRGKLEQVWYTGKMHGETVACTITGNRTTYDPGIWFNSAKFLDIEYQIYGDIPAQPSEEIDSLYWEHSAGRKAIRINYRKSDQVVTGFHLMGVRYRHLVCEKWLATGRSLKYVIEHLRSANYDPEFNTEYEPELVKVYNEKFPGDSVKLKRKSSLRRMIFGV